VYTRDEAKVHRMVMLFLMAADDDNEDKNANCLYTHNEGIVFSMEIGILTIKAKILLLSRHLSFASFPLCDSQGQRDD
jgi:hypothetical protein